jgi:membrane protease subunit (stomatin/prohibitin family)
MGITDFLKSQLIEVIEWTDDSRDTLVWRFPVQGNEIKMGAALIVREGQMAVFINEGRCADVFTPGRYKLNTQNMPILTKVMNWHHGFNSPFKAEIYFVSARQFTDRKWGTQNPIMMRDADFGVVRLRAFGSYNYRVVDPKTFIQEIVGTDGHFTTEEIDGQLRRHVVSGFSDALGEAKIPALDLAANYMELGETIREKIEDGFAGYGLEMPVFLIENINLPDEVTKYMDKRAAMGAIGDMGRYQQFQAAEAMEAAASSEGGGGMAGMGIGLGAGMGLGQTMAGAFGAAQPTAAAVAPAAAAPATEPCPSCNQPAPAGGKFCPHCGGKLGPAMDACVKCKVDLPKGSKFCPECGSKQSLECPKCSAPYAAGAKFCGECGQGLG